MKPGAGEQPLRVFCVDDSALVADSVRRRLESEPTLAWTGCTADGGAVIERVRELKPDVVLMDIDMPGVDTFGLVERLSIEAPDTRVVMLSGHAHRSFIERALDCGAWGYLSKNDDAATLMEGIRRVGRGEIALSEEVRTIHRNASP